MSKMKTIVCPYCCKRFDESIPMWFRSETGEVEVDQNLKRYYREYMHMTDEAAREASRQNKAILIDLANNAGKVGDYNKKMMEEYGFVTEIVYEGERLTRRLCPHCHNELIQSSGLYEMKLIGLYGDTSVGKTIYLTVLEAILKGDSHLGPYSGAFHGTMEYLGTAGDQREHDGSYEELLIEKTILQGTPSGIRVKPQAFLFTYKTAERQAQNRKMILVFCDIPGEDTRNKEGLEKSGFYLRKVDGILALFDPTRLPNVVGHVKGTVNEPEEGNDEEKAERSLDSLAKYLRDENGEGRIEIPAAIVTTKVDVLKEISSVSEMREFKNVINVKDANDIHRMYLNRKVISSMNKAVKNVLVTLGGNVFCMKVEQCFKNSSYFAVSALGKSPVKVGEDGNEKKIEGNLEPFRVAEPFYWLMAQFGGIPYRYREVWKHTTKSIFKGEQVTKEKIEFYYYDSERRNGDAQTKLREERKKRGIKEQNNRQWQLIELENAI